MNVWRSSTWRGPESHLISRARYQATDLVFQPRPMQRPRISVWTVEAWPYVTSLARSARWDGIIATDVSPEHEEGQNISAATVAKIAG